MCISELLMFVLFVFFFFKQKTAYEMRISDWSSDVCSSDLNVSKQHGHQILFIDAAMSLQKGEKAGLVGPNGAGKSTLFRMIVGEEKPDDGQVSIDTGMTIGYFNQDVGEMSGQSAVAAVMDGVGPVSALDADMAALDAAMRSAERGVGKEWVS